MLLHIVSQRHLCDLTFDFDTFPTRVFRDGETMTGHWHPNSVFDPLRFHFHPAAHRLTYSVNSAFGTYRFAGVCIWRLNDLVERYLLGVSGKRLTAVTIWALRWRFHVGHRFGLAFRYRLLGGRLLFASDDHQPETGVQDERCVSYQRHSDHVRARRSYVNLEIGCNYDAISQVHVLSVDSVG